MQYRAAGVRELTDRLARARVPCMSVMNMPPLPCLKRIGGLNTHVLASAYADPTVWGGFDPALVTLCSPDPQAIRPPDEPPNVLQLTLATNFKVARFASDAHTAMLRRLQDEIEAIRFDTGEGAVELPVKLKLHEVPVHAAGQVGDADDRELPLRHRHGPDHHQGRGAPRPRDLAASRAVYDFVRDLCIKLGAAPDDLVPFDKYAAAAESLARPSSAARALAAGAPHIERTDRLVQLIAAQHGLRHPVIDATVALIGECLASDRQAAA